MVVFRLYKHIALLLVASWGSLLGYIYHIDVWNKDNQYLYCLSDYHVETDYAYVQQKDLCRYASSRQAKIITEDMGSYNGSNTVVKQWIDHGSDNNKQFLLYLTDVCKKNNLDAENIEFRHESVVSAQGGTISTSDALITAQRVEDEIQQYNDGHIYNTFYKEHCAYHDNQIGNPAKLWFAPFKQSDHSIKEICAKLPFPHSLRSMIHNAGLQNHSNQAQKEWIFKLFNSYLIEPRIVHAIANNNHYKHIIVCAGGRHINGIASVLEKAGFNKIHSFDGTITPQQKNTPAMIDINTTLNQINIKNIDNPSNSINIPNIIWFYFFSLCILLGLNYIYQKKYILFSIIFIILYNSSTALKAYISQVDIWKNNHQTIYCLSDEHYPTNISIKQREAFLKIVLEKTKQGTLVIVEDMYHYDGNCTEVIEACKCYHDLPYHFLLNLTQECINNAISVKNIEFRQASNASLGGFEIPSQEVFAYSDQLKEEASLYQDGEPFDHYYKLCLEKLENLQNKGRCYFKHLRTKSDKLYTLLSKIPYKRTLDSIIDNIDSPLTIQEKKHNLVTIYDADLIDMRIMHTIAQNPSIPNIFICAGGWHIDNINQAFKDFGYTHIKHLAPKFSIDDHQATWMPKAADLSEIINQQDIYSEENQTSFNWIILIVSSIFFCGIILRRYNKAQQLLLPVVVAISSSLLNGHIYRIEKWVDLTGKHTVFTMHDFHTSTLPKNQISQKQRTEIVKAAQARNAGVIVEDMYLDIDALLKNPTNYDAHSVKTLCDKEVPANQTTPLIALTPACKDKSVPVKNVEFRQPSLISLSKKGSISAADCLKATERVQKQIECFNDSSIHNAFYRNIIQKHKTLQNEGQYLFNQIKATSEKSAHELFENNMLNYSPTIDKALKTFGWSDRKLDNSTKTQKMEALFNYYDAGLIDACIIHNLYLYRNKPTIFICAGFKHIENIETIMHQLGYSKKNQHGSELFEAGMIEPSALDIHKAMQQVDPIVSKHKTPTQKNCFALLCLVAIACCYIAGTYRPKTKASC